MSFDDFANAKEDADSEKEPDCASEKKTKAISVGRHSTMLRVDGPSLNGRVENISSILRPSEVEARNAAAGENNQNMSYSVFSSGSIAFSDDAETVENNNNGSDHSASSSLPQALGNTTMDILKNIDV